MSIEQERADAALNLRKATTVIAALRRRLALERALIRDTYLTDDEREAWWGAHDWATDRGLV